MFKQGDIILVNSYSSHSRRIKRHSFIVIDDGGGVAEDDGKRFYFDFIAVVMSSERSAEHLRYKLLKYPGNFPVGADERIITMASGGNQKNGYVKCDQFYFFREDREKMFRIGYIVPEIFGVIMEYVNELGNSIDPSTGEKFEFEYILDNVR